MPSPSPPLPPPVVPKLSDFRVVFETVPFGMTVSRDGTTHRAAIVTRVVSSGQASRVGIQVGDLIVGIENNWIEGYDDFLATIKKVNYPVSLVIRRAQRS